MRPVRRLIWLGLTLAVGAGVLLGVAGAATPTVSWTQLSPSVSPTARWSSAVATRGNGDVVLFGGTLTFNPSAVVTDETWVWDGANWSQPALSTRPAPRTTATMARDKNGKLVLFGGFILNSGTPVDYGDTWLWDGSSWSQASPLTSPPARSSAAMATDRNGNVVLYGGYGASGILSDTWLWDGSNWTQLSPASSPGPRGAASMARDKNGNLVLFGGRDDFGSARGDTWLWDGTNWTQPAPSNGPTARTDYAVAADAQGNVVLFGGSNPSYQNLADTWLWDGSNWTDVSPNTSPDAREWAMTTTDRSGGVSLFGGQGSAPENDSWLFTVVADRTPPVLTVPAGVTTNATGPGGAPVLFTATATDPDDAASNPVCAPASGSVFPTGTTQVNCTSTDTHGLTGTGQFTVHVKSAAEQLVDLGNAVKGVGPGRILPLTVQGAQSLVTSGHTQAACVALDTFKLEVRLFTPRLINATQSATLIASGLQIMMVLDGPCVSANLIVDPGAEAAAGGDGSTLVAAPGWTVSGNLTVVNYALGEPGGWPGPTSPGPPSRGANFFSGGPDNAGSSASQTISLAGYASQIDQATVGYDLGGWLGGFDTQNDNARCTVTFKDKNGATVGSATIGPVLAADRGNIRGFVNREQTGIVPVATRSALLQLVMTRTDGAFNDGYADNLSLVVTK